MGQYDMNTLGSSIRYCREITKTESRKTADESSRKSRKTAVKLQLNCCSVVDESHVNRA